VSFFVFPLLLHSPSPGHVGAYARHLKFMPQNVQPPCSADERFTKILKIKIQHNKLQKQKKQNTELPLANTRLKQFLGLSAKALTQILIISQNWARLL